MCVGSTLSVSDGGATAFAGPKAFAVAAALEVLALFSCIAAALIFSEQRGIEYKSSAVSGCAAEVAGWCVRNIEINGATGGDTSASEAAISSSACES